MTDKFISLLFESFTNGQIRLNEQMSKHTTFRIGGPAEIYAEPESAGELTRLVSLSGEHEVPFNIIGGGANILAADKGVRGLVISTARLKGISLAGEDVVVGAGESLRAAAGFCLKNSLAGFEFAAGIPGTIGGAIYMNAGAYGREIKDVAKSAEIIDESGGTAVISGESLGFGYRTSVFQKRGVIILSAVFGLKPGIYEEIKAETERLADMRAKSQPLSEPSAGSAFKRPEGHFPGKLIEESGLSGFAVGGAAVSPKHCGFIVNTEGAATAADVKRLIEHIQETVYARFGVALEPEIRFLGDF